MFIRRAKPIRINGDPDNKRPYEWIFMVFISVNNMNWSVQFLFWGRKSMITYVKFPYNFAKFKASEVYRCLNQQIIDTTTSNNVISS